MAEKVVIQINLKRKSAEKTNEQRRGSNFAAVVPVQGSEQKRGVSNFAMVLPVQGGQEKETSLKLRGGAEGRKNELDVKLCSGCAGAGGAKHKR